MSAADAATKTPRTLQQALAPDTDPAWILDQHGYDPLLASSRDSRFAISNGFLGIRGGRTINRVPSPDISPRTYVAGLFDTLGADQPVSALVAAPDWLRIDLALSTQGSGSSNQSGSAPISEQAVGRLLFWRRTLDFKRGALITESRAAGAPNLAVRVRVLRLVSLSSRAVGLQVIEIAFDSGDADVTLEASFDGLACGLVCERLEQGLGVWRTNTTAKRLAMASAAELHVDGSIVAGKSLAPLRWSWTWTARPGQIVHFQRMVAVALGDALGDAVAEDTVEQAQNALADSVAMGWAGVLDRHEARWAERWHASDVMVGGDPDAQHALRFALYHLNGAANPQDDKISIAARALTGADYHGHVFWDTEIFLLPFYTFTWPEAARALLMYRFNTLGGARAKARDMGWRGALYAWESTDTGAETCPQHVIGPDRRIMTVLCGTQEQHISADVAYAVWHYWQTTGDDAFLCHAGAEILLETARFWSSRAQEEADGHCHIRGVIGPDEYHETIDDNAFTNVMARWNIRRALEMAKLLRQNWPDHWARLSSGIGLDDAELRQWAKVADAIATGFDPETGLFEQFTGFFKLEPVDLAQYAGRSVPMDVVLGQARTQSAQIIKQADVVALLALLPDEFADGEAAANFAYYAPLCSHGSSLSAALHGVAAARLNQTDLAMRFFLQTAATDLADTHAAIDGGVHIAALGGLWMMAVLGFAGLAITETGLSFDPNLPECWRSLAFSVQWRGRNLSVSIDRETQSFAATLTFGQPMIVTLGGEQHRLSAEAPLAVALIRKGSSSFLKKRTKKLLAL